MHLKDIVSGDIEPYNFDFWSVEMISNKIRTVESPLGTIQLEHRCYLFLNIHKWSTYALNFVMMGLECWKNKASVLPVN